MFPAMKRAWSQRWPFILGMIAMLGQFLAVPASTAAAIAQAPRAAAALLGHDVSPGGRHCPDCPPECPKACPEMAACVLTCFPSAAPPPTAGQLAAPLERRHVHGVLRVRRLAGTLTPPRLRPPIL